VLTPRLRVWSWTDGPSPLSQSPWLPVLVGALVVIAGLAKAHQILTGPLTNAFQSPVERWLPVSLMASEVAFGLWLWSGLYPRRARTLAIALFSVYLAVSLFQALSGSATCGCFGNVPMSPWFTATMDTAVIIALCHWHPPGTGDPRPDTVRRRFLRPGIASGSLLVVVALMAAALPPDPAKIADNGLISGQGVVLLEPHTWLGKRLPLLP
jgi:hypothetical protein